MCCRKEYDGRLEFDLGNLAAFDKAPLDKTAFENDIEDGCNELATKIFQSLTHKLFDLPFEVDQVGRIAELPVPSTLLPREKPVPKPRPPTKWEVFAQRKGIVKRKKSNLEWDEPNQEWRRRHGYKKVNDETEIPIIEAKPSETTGSEDPFTKSRREKRDRIKKNSSQQLANLKTAAKEGGVGALPATLRLAATLPEHGRGKPSKRKEMLPELRRVSKQVAVSTASLGRHDKVIQGENLKLRKISSSTKKHLSATVNPAIERAQQGKLVDHILRKNADDIVDIGKAIGKFEAAAKSSDGPRMKKKGANKKGRLEGKQQQPKNAQQKGKRTRK